MMTRQEKIKKLNTLPWQALIELAKENEIPEEEIKGLGKDNLIQKIISCVDLEDERIESLVNDYIYGDRVTFTLWSFENSLSDKDYNKLLALEGNTEEYLDIKDFRNLKILSVKQYSDRFELLYTYSKIYSFTNEEGKNDSVWELHRGCVWIGIEKSYIASISKHDKMTNCLLRYLYLNLRNNIIPIKPPKTAIERCIQIMYMSRITLQRVDGAKTTISKSDGFTTDQEEEIARIKEGRFDTSGSYRAEIKDKTTATIKYNIKKGSIGIYRHLSANDLFYWTNNTINIILDEIENLKCKPAEIIYSELGLPLKWNILHNGNDSCLNWFLSQVISAQNNDVQIVIPNNIIGILSNTRLFIKIPRIYCEECESYDIPICAECGEPLLCANDSFTCSCGAPIHIMCGEGHKKCKHINWYIPTGRFISEIQRNYRLAFQGQQASINMCIMEDTLFLQCNKNEVDTEIEVDFDSIKEFQYPQSKDLMKCQSFAVRLNEKCSKSCTNKEINNCIQNNNQVCLPKLFWGLISGYRPQPHSGYEYGDVSGQLQVANTYLEFKGIIKKNSQHKKNSNKTTEELISQHLLSTSREGEEMIRQFVEQGLSDSRCQVIAVIVPQFFDLGFKGTLRFLARLGNKKVLFIGLDEISKMISMNDNIALA